ncbi:uncharacterized protein LOC127419363 isoform X2 [Myxocyprinus asiaticus]|uniref:uncharacterized protein LOC127419363 isoform X2 n=1 Tax=Myxocyprinus asiaticus TaxID=70543 RepID=UPI0022236F65|nr:uncharacterized protein LOC127419363 isoform X2 [Myxocyprinus asiaticus]
MESWQPESVPAVSTDMPQDFSKVIVAASDGLNGGKPCFKYVNSRHGIGTPVIVSPAPTFQRAIKSNEGVVESCSSSPLFIPLGMERSVQRTRKLSKDAGVLSIDSEDMNGSVKERRRHKHQKEQCSQRVEGKGSEESQSHKANEIEAKPFAFQHP